MTEIPPDMRVRRALEDEALRIGRERAELADRTRENTWEIIELLRRPEHALIPLDHLAQLLGVSRPSIYRWRERAQEIPAGTSVAEWLSVRDPDTRAALRYKG
jgi:hypothetical protein